MARKRIYKSVYQSTNFNNPLQRVKQTNLKPVKGNYDAIWQQIVSDTRKLNN